MKGASDGSRSRLGKSGKGTSLRLLPLLNPELQRSLSLLEVSLAFVVQLAARFRKSTFGLENCIENG